MSSPGKSFRPTSAVSTATTISNNETDDDFQAFQMRHVIRDFKLSAELFASNGEIVLICGRNQERQGTLLVSYEIPSVTVSGTVPIRLVKVIKLSKKSVKQLETIPVLKLALLLADGAVSLLDIDTLVEIAVLSSGTINLFATWYEMPAQQFVPSTPMMPASASNVSKAVPTELRIAAATKRRSLVFYRWLPQQRRLEENKELRGGFDLLDVPYALALSSDRVCVGYKRSYAIINLANGMNLSEVPFGGTYEPVINCLQDRSQWCIQVESNTVFLRSNFEPLYENGITWRDIPSCVVQASPYVLSLMNQTIDICTFNGSEFVPLQQISYRNPTMTGKCRLWMDARTDRIYVGTPTDVAVLERIPVHIQLKNYVGRFRYNLALVLLRAVLGISTSSSSPMSDQPRTTDGHAKGITDQSNMPKQIVFNKNEQSSAKFSMNSSMLPPNESSGLNQPLTDAELWTEYYRIGTMNAFQMFRKMQVEQAFAAFSEFLTDPGEVVCLFEPLSPKDWLPDSYNEFKAFVNRHPHFSEPNDLIGKLLESALKELQRYLTDSRRIFQTIVRRSPDSWLEVQSLVHHRFILKPARDLLTIVETALLKAYLYENNCTLANALLRNQDNCCLPSEVEKELQKYHRYTELVAFYEKQNRHNEALNLIATTERPPTNNSILNYLSKLGNDQLALIFKYIEPMLRSALNEKRDEDLIYEIIDLFIDDSMHIPQSSGNMSVGRTMKLNPTEVFAFLNKIDQDVAIKYLNRICFKPELGTQQRNIHDRLVFAYTDRIKQLSEELKPMVIAIREVQKSQESEVYKDNDSLATEMSSINMDKFPGFAAIKKQKNTYEENLKMFLLNDNCQCDFERLEAHFLQEQKDPLNASLFSLYYAFVLGKLNQHEKALETFVSHGFYTDAEQYCEKIYLNGNVQLAQELYHRLIEYYLKKSNNGTGNDAILKTTLRILNRASDRLDPVKTLEILPGLLKLNNLTSFVENALQTRSTIKRNSHLERNLLFLKLLRTQSDRISSENHSFIIDGDTRCARIGCTQPFTARQAVVRFPNNKIVHLNCRAKYEDERNKLSKRDY